MSVTLKFSSAFKTILHGGSDLELEVNSVRNAITELENRYPGFEKYVLDVNGAPLRFIRFFINSKDIRSLDGLDTKLKHGDQLTILQALAGG